MWDKNSDDFNTEYKLMQLGELFLCAVMLGISIALTIMALFVEQGLTFRIFGVIMILFWFRWSVVAMLKLRLIMNAFD